MTEIDKILRIYNLLDKSDYKTAIKEALVYIKQGAKLPFLYHSVSIAYIATEQFKEALAILKEGEKKFPVHVEFYELFGEVYSCLQDTDNAIKYFELAMGNADKTDKKSISALMTSIANLKFLKGEEKEAKDLYERALELDPKNPDAKKITRIFNQAPVDMDKLKKTAEICEEFFKQKESEFLRLNNINKFRSDAEDKKIQLKINTAYRSEILPNLEIIKELSADSRKEWFKRIEIDFVNDVPDTKSESQILYEKEVNERFSFLPENAITIAYIARPALKSAGMPEEKLLNFIEGISRPNKKDIKLLKWAYEIGKKYLELDKYNDDFPAFEKDFLDIITERLNKERALICLFQIIENEMHR